MTPEQSAKLDAIGNELARTIRELDAAKDMIAVLLAELALPHDNPEGYLAEVEEDERDAVYAAATHHEAVDETLRRTMLAKAEYKTSIFSLARMVLARLSSNR